MLRKDSQSTWKALQAIDDSEFIKTLFPTAYKSMYKEPERIDEGDEGNEGPQGPEGPVATG